jgi:hypothetical protein
MPLCPSLVKKYQYVGNKLVNRTTTPPLAIDNWVSNGKGIQIIVFFKNNQYTLASTQKDDTVS